MANSKFADNLIYLLGVNTRVLHRQLDGLSDNDLLLQPDMRGNCFNWVLGHIINGRNSILKRLGEEPVWAEDEAGCYQRESGAITGPESPHLSMEHLLQDHQLTGDKIIARLETITDAELDEKISDDTTLGKSLSFSVWHEAYHTGQFEYLRQLTGVNDKVI
jgi:uncharacterized damage-inducible protein DinB